MKLLTFKSDNKILLGFQIKDYIFQVDTAYKYFFNKPTPVWINDMRSLLEYGESGLEQIESLVEKTKRFLSKTKDQIKLKNLKILHSIKEVKIMAPIINPEKIICIGLNYRDHCTEQNIQLPKRPILFSKFSTALIGYGDNIVRPLLTKKLDFEGELAFIIGKQGKNIHQEEAMQYIAGYSIFHDVSARDIQFADRQWLRGKTFDTFAPMGPILVTKDEIENPHNLNIKVMVNETIMQNSNTKNMIFDIPYLVNFISQVVPLSPGDIVSTGTPSGVGVFRKPQVFLKEGDEVVINIEKLGVLRNRVVDEK